MTLAHGLHRDVLREGMGTLAAVRLARRHAERLERSGLRRSDDRYRVALLRLDADGQAPADMLDAALELARSARDLDSLERLSRAWPARVRQPRRGPSAGRGPLRARPLRRGRRGAGRGGGQVGRPRRPRHPGRPAASPGPPCCGYGLGRLDEAGRAAGRPGRRRGTPPGRSRAGVRIRRVQLEAWRSGPAAALAVLDEPPVGGVTPQDDADAVSFSERGVRAVALALSGRPVEAVALAGRRAGPGARAPGPDELALVLALTEAGRPRRGRGGGPAVLDRDGAGPAAARPSCGSPAPSAGPTCCAAAPGWRCGGTGSSSGWPASSASGCPLRWLRAG